MRIIVIVNNNSYDNLTWKAIHYYISAFIGYQYIMLRVCLRTVILQSYTGNIHYNKQIYNVLILSNDEFSLSDFINISIYTLYYTVKVSYGISILPVFKDNLLTSI